MTKQIVYIESPFSGDIELNLAYLGACMLDCIERGEVPIASHGDLPRWLDDTDPKQRAIGIRIGFERAKVCDKSVVYEDFGRSEGMKLGIEDAGKNGRPVEFRNLRDYRKFFTIRNNIHLLFEEFVKVCGFSKDELYSKSRKPKLCDAKSAWVVISSELYPNKKLDEIGSYINKDRTTCYFHLQNSDVKEKKSCCQKLKFKLGL
jgi:hypothetical protein